MLNVDNFIGDHITFRRSSMFAPDIAANSDRLRQEVEGKSLLVIGGAGSIGSSYIKAILPFKPAQLPFELRKRRADRPADRRCGN